MRHNLSTPPGCAIPWCQVHHEPGQATLSHTAEFVFTGVRILWVQPQMDGVLSDPSVRVIHALADGPDRTIEFRTTSLAADVGDLFSVVRTEELADICACLTAAYEQTGDGS
ncbi:hypothetical protein ACSDR0_43375 [Streptosporangium sp. G11]|uniref:hypothetical protein n=1 Tax=Streptosporangium sp. G11 TaxID=3436926 RepID=UPI003EBEB6A7